MTERMLKLVRPKAPKTAPTGFALLKNRRRRARKAQPVAERISRKVKGLSPSGIRKFFDLIQGDPDVISLGVGEPDFVTPREFTARAVSALEAGNTRYTSNYGLLELRETVAEYTQRIGGPAYDPKREILITVGVSEGVDLALRALLDPGDEVILADPCYVSYEPMIQMAGGVPVPVPTCMADGFRLKPERIEAAITPRSKLLLLSYPANPTGASLSRAELEAIAAIVRKHDLLVIADEIYDRLTYSGAHTVFSSLPGMEERTVYLNGFSKAYAMTGWRVGYLCANPAFVEAMMKIHQYAIMCVSTMGQHAALAAMRGGWQEMERMVDSYRRRRTLVLESLFRLGLPCAAPDGAFYAFPSIRETGLDSEIFCTRLFREEKVVVVPGSVFGAQGEGHVRLCYATAAAQLSAAFERMERFLERVRSEKQRTA